jgi:hypothetical protein
MGFLFFMYSSSSHEEPGWLFFFLSESSSKIQAQSVDGPSMWVGTCSFVVLTDLFLSSCLWSLLDSFLPSLLLFRRVVCVGKSQRETDRDRERVFVCESSVETRSVFFLLLLLLLLGLFCFPKIQSLGQFFAARVCGSSGGLSILSTSADHLQRANDEAREASTRNEHAATTSFQATVVVVVVPSSASPSSTPYTTASILSFFGGFPAIKPKTIIPTLIQTKILAFKPNPNPSKKLEKKSQTQKFCWEFNEQISVFASNKKVDELGLCVLFFFWQNLFSGGCDIMLMMLMIFFFLIPNLTQFTIFLHFL